MNPYCYMTTCIGCSPQLIEGICPDSKAGRTVAELVGALQLMVDRFRDTEGSYGAGENEALEAANAAIAKATWGEG
jgi:hypothetical protein